MHTINYCSSFSQGNWWKHRPAYTQAPQDQNCQLQPYGYFACLFLKSFFTNTTPVALQTSQTCLGQSNVSVDAHQPFLDKIGQDLENSVFSYNLTAYYIWLQWERQHWYLGKKDWNAGEMTSRVHVREKHRALTLYSTICKENALIKVKPAIAYFKICILIDYGHTAFFNQCRVRIKDITWISI